MARSFLYQLLWSSLLVQLCGTSSWQPMVSLDPLVPATSHTLFTLLCRLCLPTENKGLQGSSSFFSSGHTYMRSFCLASSGSLLTYVQFQKVQRALLMGFWARINWNSFDTKLFETSISVLRCKLLTHIPTYLSHVGTESASTACALGSKTEGLPNGMKYCTFQLNRSHKGTHVHKLRHFVYWCSCFSLVWRENDPLGD